MPPWEQLLGPYGLVIGAILLVVVLGRLHLKSDDRRDKALELLQDSQPALIATVKVQAETISERLSKGDKT